MENTCIYALANGIESIASAPNREVLKRKDVLFMAQAKEKANLRHFSSSSNPPTIFDSKVNIPSESRRALIELLNARLVDTIDLQSQAKFAHWNVKGHDFYQLHLLFDSIAEHLEEGVDLIAANYCARGQG